MTAPLVSVTVPSSVALTACPSMVLEVIAKKSVIAKIIAMVLHIPYIVASSNQLAVETAFQQLCSGRTLTKGKRFVKLHLTADGISCQNRQILVEFQDHALELAQAGCLGVPRSCCCFERLYF